MATNPSLRLAGLAAALAMGCGSGERPDPESRSPGPGEGRALVEDRGSAERPGGDRPPSPSLAEQAVVATFGSPEAAGPLVVAAMADLDGVGNEDTIFAASADRGCVLVRIAPRGTRVDALPLPMAGSPADTRCVATVRTQNGSLVLVAADNGQTASRQGIIQVHAVPREGEATVVYQEVFPFAAEWSLRSVSPTQVELVGAHAEPALVPTIYKLIQAQAQTWTSASCWSVQPAAGPTQPLHCPVTLGDGISERRLEGQTFGPPAFAGEAVVIGAGEPAAAEGAVRSWCVAFPDGHSAWLALPSTLTNDCTGAL